MSWIDDNVPHTDGEMLLKSRKEAEEKVTIRQYKSSSYYWRTKNNESLYIPDMNTQHLLNVLAMLIRNKSVYNYQDKVEIILLTLQERNI